MNIIKQSFTFLGDCPTANNKDAMKRVEQIGRICYQSQDRITNDSYGKFVDKLVEDAHTSMVEHSNLVIKVKGNDCNHLLAHKYLHSVKLDNGWVIAGNYRTWMHIYNVTDWRQVETMVRTRTNGTIIRKVSDIPTPLRAITVVLKTDRAVSHELVRHRPCSFAQLSQRYVDHKKGVGFILPLHYYKAHDEQEDNAAYATWKFACARAEISYTQLREAGESPQYARSVLPNSTATEIAVTAYIPEWAEIIFPLRTAPNAYYMIKDIMSQIKEEFISKGLI